MKYTGSKADEVPWQLAYWQASSKPKSKASTLVPQRIRFQTEESQEGSKGGGHSAIRLVPIHKAAGMASGLLI